jgi:hypothetical protein
MALGRECAVGTWLRMRTTMCLGLWLDGAGNSCTNGSPEATGCGGALSIREEPDVLGILHRVGRPLGRLWAREPGRYRGGLRACNRHGPVCAVLRRTNAPQNVRRGI